MEGTWLGRPLSELSREELLAVIDYLTPFYQKALDPLNARALALGKIEMWKSGGVSPQGFSPL